MNNKMFVSSTHNVHYGKEAEEKLKETNDTKYLTEDGVLSVPEERWYTAQQYEEMYWCNIDLNAKEDRNHDHELHFHNYDNLKNIKFNSMIELGCGPFTNSKIILEHIGKDVKKVSLLDPLIHKYMMLPNCTYKNGELNGKKVEIISSSIEEYSTTKKYDLVVMINVLEHCSDFYKVFSVIDNILKKDGFFVLAEATVKNQSMKETISNIYDAGHPIRITDRFFSTYIKEKYKIEYQIIFDNLYNNDIRRDYYYILRKK